MAYPTLGNYGFAAAPQASTKLAGTTTPFGVNPGDSVYVFIGYATDNIGSITVSSVQDSLGHTYTKIAAEQNVVNALYPATEIWYKDILPGTAALDVTVTFSAKTFFAVSAVQVQGVYTGGSYDDKSNGASGLTSTTPPGSLDSVTSTNANDLVVAFICLARQSGTMYSGSDFTPCPQTYQFSGGVLAMDLGTDGWYVNQGSPAALDSKLYTDHSKPYSILTVAIRSAPPLGGVSATLASGVLGKPFVTVSSKGAANLTSGLPNAGADFGPDTPGPGSGGLTKTSGIQEAINAGAEKILLTDRNVYYITVGIATPAKYSLDMEGAAGTGLSGYPTTIAINPTGWSGSNMLSLSTFPGTYSGSTPTPTGQTTGVRMENITFQSNGVSLGAVVDLSQAEESTSFIIENCAFEGSGSATASLIMNGNEDSVLRDCRCVGAPLQWYVPFGALHISGGFYDALRLAAQLGVVDDAVLNGQVAFLGGTPLEKSVFALNGCYMNPFASATAFNNASNYQIYLAIRDSYLYANPGSASGPNPPFYGTNAGNNFFVSFQNSILVSSNPSSTVNIASTPGTSTIYRDLLSYFGSGFAFASVNAPSATYAA